MFNWLKRVLKESKQNYIRKQLEVNKPRHVLKTCKNCAFGKVHNDYSISENDVCICSSIVEQIESEKERYLNRFATGNEKATSLRDAISLCKGMKWRYKFAYDVNVIIEYTNAIEYIVEFDYDYEGREKYRKIIFTDVTESI